MKYLCLIILLSVVILSVTYAQGTLSVTLGGSYTNDDPDEIKPDAGFLAGYNVFHSFTDTISLFSSLGGFFDYRYLDAEWHYLYDCSLDISFRGNTFLIKPSVTCKGEQYYASEFSLPHVWENSGELFCSYDIGSSSLFISPGFSWEDDLFFIKGKTGYVFSILTRYVVSLALSAGKTVFESENDEFYVYPEATLSLYPDKPYTLSFSFTFTWYDSDYESEVGDASEPLPIYDFTEFFSDVEYSVVIGEKVSCTIYIPFSLILKRHHAVENETVPEEDEWIFSSGIQTDIGIDFLASHRCVISLSGEKAFSNSTYQDTAECAFSIAYEFLF